MPLDTIETVILVGVLGIVAAGLLAIIAQLILSYLAQRNLNDIHSLGIEAVIAQNQQSELSRNLNESNESVNIQNNADGNSG